MRITSSALLLPILLAWAAGTGCGNNPRQNAIAVTATGDAPQPDPEPQPDRVTELTRAEQDLADFTQAIGRQSTELDSLRANAASLRLKIASLQPNALKRASTLEQLDPAQVPNEAPHNTDGPPVVAVIEGGGDAHAFAPDGTTLATADTKGDTYTIRLWDLSGTRPVVLDVVNTSDARRVNALAFSANGTILASGAMIESCG